MEVKRRRPRRYQRHAFEACEQDPCRCHAWLPAFKPFPRKYWYHRRKGPFDPKLVMCSLDEHHPLHDATGDIFAAAVIRKWAVPKIFLDQSSEFVKLPEVPKEVWDYLAEVDRLAEERSGAAPPFTSVATSQIPPASDADPQCPPAHSWPSLPAPEDHPR